jgi:hypothetical protein
VVELRPTNMGCGTWQLVGITGEPQEILRGLVRSAWGGWNSAGRKSCYPAIIPGDCPPPFVMFTSVETARTWKAVRNERGLLSYSKPVVASEATTRPGLRFARYIRRHKLGRVVASDERFNSYHGTNDLKAFIWTPDWEAVRKFGVAEGIIDEQGNVKKENLNATASGPLGYL